MELTQQGKVVTHLKRQNLSRMNDAQQSRSQGRPATT
jgi:hypothetical protein